MGCIDGYALTDPCPCLPTKAMQYCAPIRLDILPLFPLIPRKIHNEFAGGSLAEFYRALLQYLSSSSYHRHGDTDPSKGGSSTDSCEPPHLGWPRAVGALPPWRVEGRACPACFSPRCSLERARQPQRPDGCDPRGSPESSPHGGLRLHPRACGPRVRTADSQWDFGGEKRGERRE